MKFNRTLLWRAAPASGQLGSTFLGVIVGVLVGLAAALAVAVYVTNVPVPFVNKGASRGAEHDAAEIKKNKDWDPNGPLAGKPAKTPAAAASGAAEVADVKSAGKAAENAAEKSDKAEKASDKPPEKTTEKAVEKTATKVADKAVDKALDKPIVAKEGATKPDGDPKPKATPTDPLGDLAKSKAKAGAEVDPFIYFVQVGAFRTPEDAEAQKAKLSLAGVEAKITEREVSGRTVFRVRVGPLEKKEDADKSKERIEGLGVDAQLVRANR